MVIYRCLFEYEKKQYENTVQLLIEKAKNMNKENKDIDTSLIHICPKKDIKISLNL